MTATDTPFLPLADLLYSQGFGTRRICAGLVQQGLVSVDGVTVTDTLHPVPARAGQPFCVQGQQWLYQPRACLALYKPAGFECSHRPSAWPSVYTLLPAPLRQRPQKGAVQGVQAVGRLDQDTTGLLILTDDGQLIHQMSSPRRHVAKLYQVQCKHPLTAQQLQRLLDGVVLDDDPRPVRAAAADQTGSYTLDLTLTQGKYHQVKRMLAAVGNRVESLHRKRIGAYILPDDLQPGQWCWLTDQDVQRLLERADVSP